MHAYPNSERACCIPKGSGLMVICYSQPYSYVNFLKFLRASCLAVDSSNWNQNSDGHIMTTQILHAVIYIFWIIAQYAGYGILLRNVMHLFMWFLLSLYLFARPSTLKLDVAGSCETLVFDLLNYTPLHSRRTYYWCRLLREPKISNKQGRLTIIHNYIIHCVQLVQWDYTSFFLNNGAHALDITYTARLVENHLLHNTR
jgi:hypothetical protein